MTTIDVDVTQPAPIYVGLVDQPPIVVGVAAGRGPAGPAGPVGPPGPSGADIVAVPYDEWPPAAPQPDTLYLRLAP